MKSKYFIMSLIIVIILVAVILLVLKFKDNNKGNITELESDNKLQSISYHYSGTAIGDIYSYYIYKENDKVKLKVDIMNINSENPDIVVLNEKILDEIMKLIIKHKVIKMDGYNKSNPNVLDGDSFAVSIKLSNNKEISFSGSNCAPKGFHEFEKDFLKLIKKETDQIKGKYEL